MNDQYILYYFPLNARGSLIRALLTLGNANWENRLINFQDWPALKSSGKFEFGQLPALEVNGKCLTQSLAIENYLAQKLGFNGSNPEEQYEIVSLLCSREDLLHQIRNFFFPSEKDKKNLDQIKTNLLTNVLPNFLRIYEKRVNSRQGKYLVGGRLTLADIFLVIHVHIIFWNPTRKEEFAKVLTEHAPNLEKWVLELTETDFKEFFEKSYIQNSFF
jgi:glutathione S-transferase